MPLDRWKRSSIDLRLTFASPCRFSAGALQSLPRRESTNQNQRVKAKRADRIPEVPYVTQVPSGSGPVVTMLILRMAEW
jgi:hypothetical protein